MLIQRTIFHQVKESLSGEPKIIVILGPRQSGKTTLINQLLDINKKTDQLSYTGDDLLVQETFSKAELAHLTTTIGTSKLLIIDEAQRIENIGLTMKLIYDHLHIPILVSGSSSLDLTSKVREALTGRTTTYHLYPLSVAEVPPAPTPTLPTGPNRYDNFLRYGLYPKTVTLAQEKQKEDYLYELINGYLYKDILAFQNVRKPKKVIDLLTLIALQLGNEVSLPELAQNLSIARPVVEKYLDLLEQMFILVNLRGFSRNLRKEISKSSKYFFWDLGLRNTLIRNFNPLYLRNDTGALWENFCIVERMKLLSNAREFANWYFWRTYDQKEIDLIEERGGQLKGFEFKQKPQNRLPSAFKEFSSSYPGSSLTTITPHNFADFQKI